MLSKMTSKTKIQVGLIIILLVFVISLLLAQKATPDFPPFFALKRVQEKMFMKVKTSPQSEVDYMRSLLNTRLEELSSQVNRRSYGYILPSALRYSTLAGQITEIISQNNLKDEVASAKEQFIAHQKVLQDLYVVYPKNTENVEYK